MRDEAAAAAGLVFVGSSDLDTRLGLHGSLGIISGGAAFDADGVGFCNKFGDGEELRHGVEGFARIILVQACNDHPLAAFSKLVYGVDYRNVEELGFVD